MKKILSIILAITSVFSLATFSASAEETDKNTVVISSGDTEFVFEAGVSEDHIHSFIQSFEANEHNSEESATYGLMCTLFGHKIESSVVSTLTHKASATDPRCLQRIYSVESCSRCDYTAKTLISTKYISCC